VRLGFLPGQVTHDLLLEFLPGPLGIALALCSQGAQSNFSPSLRATFTNSLALVHPINRSSGFAIFGRCSRIAIR
jgi:hypothetical protein